MSDRTATALATGGLGFLAGLGSALALGLLLQPFCVDQPIAPADLLGWGQRWGLLLGTFSACGATLGGRRPASPLQVLGVVITAAAALVALALLGGSLAGLAVRLGWFGQQWGLPSRTTYALGIGATGSAEWLGVPLALASALRLRSARRLPR